MDTLLELLSGDLPPEPARGGVVIGVACAVLIPAIFAAVYAIDLGWRVKALERRLDPWAADPTAARMGVRVSPEVP